MTTPRDDIQFLKKDDIKNIDLKGMTKEERYGIWKRIPKVELHCHLDLTFSGEFFLKWIRKYNLQPDMSDEEVLEHYLFTKEGSSLAEFIRKAISVSNIYRDYEILEDLAKSAVIEKYKEGVVLMEFRYSPTFVSSMHGLDVELIHKAFVKGIKNATEMLDNKIHVALICISDTGHAAASIKHSGDFAIKHKHDFVGFDHGGREIDLKDHKDVYHSVRAQGLHLTVHAGEDATLPNLNTLYTAINILNVERIGHGIRVSESEELIDLVKKNDILLEVCPISNLLLNNVKSMDTHPIRQLYDAGVKVSVNSDDPGMFLTDINDNYDRLFVHLNFTLDEFLTMNQWALEKSFVSDDIKNKIKSLYF
ncbi:adenosine deaminase, putative [Plasmodium vinckei brucechwatti]|uniref:Adenosine deaminase n=1 Tax=Plasmodium vinckei brucechwatti TaxID=119398 RepID=A0A6V7RZD9_PLAVN|nr:adenosine deaminase, putative [Plasmodium vinckei brucechwatti]